MNETLQTIFTRRSIRSFTDQPISKEHLDLLVQAALCAPSGMGLQTWQFTVVSSREKIPEPKIREAISREKNRRRRRSRRMMTRWYTMAERIRWQKMPSLIKERARKRIRWCSSAVRAL